MEEYFSGKSVLVTGAAGFIGRCLLRHLHRLGAKIVAFDKVKGEELPGVRWVIGDLLELKPEYLGESTIEIVFHLAAILGVSYAGQNPIQTIAVNSFGTGHLLKLVRGLHAEVVCILSSSEIYGEPDVLPITENHKLCPLSVYGWSKVCAEQLLEAHTHSGKLRGIAIRPFNVYGPGQRDDFVVSRFLQQARQGLPLTVAGDGKQQRLFTFVDDLVYGVMLAVLKSKPGFQAYNIAGEEPISIAGLANLILSVVGSNVQPTYMQLADLGRDSASEVHMRTASIEKAKRELGYRPQVSLEQGLQLSISF